MKYLLLMLLSFSSFAGIPTAKEAKDKSLPIKQNLTRLRDKMDNAIIEYSIQRSIANGESSTIVNVNHIEVKTEIMVSRLIELGYKAIVREESYGTYIEISW